MIIGTLALLASIPGQTMGVGVFADNLISALNLSRTQLSTAYMLGTIGSSLLLPFGGTVLDRVGARVMLAISSFGLGLSSALLSQSDRVASYFAPDSFYAVMFVVTGCFLFMRFFGQGCLAMVSRVTIGKWFNHRRGLATAISGVFVSFSFSVAPRALDELLRTWGWRVACLMLAGTVGIAMFIVGLIFLRDNPEECGLVMDGVDDEAWHSRMAAKIPKTRREFTRPEALRTPAFWAFNFGVSTQALVVTGLTFNVSSLGAEVGLSREQAYELFLPMSAFTVATTFVCGWLSDRIKLKWMLIVMLVAQSVGSVGMMGFGESFGWWLLVSGFGVSGGFYSVLLTVVWPRFFGRKHLGAISGVNMSTMVLASAMAPVMFAKAYELTGSYREVIAVCWSMPIAVILLALTAENPQEKISVEADASQFRKV
ncbi:MAG: MFS transporter [Phycisphaerales bacterium]|nr:MFS transporter [Phycisphaerales bacterium]